MSDDNAVDDNSLQVIQVCDTDEVCVLIQVELEVESLNRRLRLVEDELEQSQTRLQTTQDQLHEANKVADETDRFVTSYLWFIAAAAAADDDDDDDDVTSIW